MGSGCGDGIVDQILRPPGKLPVPVALNAPSPTLFRHYYTPKERKSKYILEENGNYLIKEYRYMTDALRQYRIGWAQGCGSYHRCIRHAIASSGSLHAKTAATNRGFAQEKEERKMKKIN